MASRNSTIFLPSDLDQISDRWKFLREEKQAGNKTDIVNDEIVARVDKLLEYK